MNYFLPDHLQDSQKTSSTNNFGLFFFINSVLIIWFSGDVQSIFGKKELWAQNSSYPPL
jgi:hypothetical protein